MRTTVLSLLTASVLSLAFVSAGCARAPQAPEKGARETFYSLLPVNAGYGNARVAVQILSDSTRLSLDSAGTIRGIDPVFSTWKSLWNGANITSVARTVISTSSPTALIVRDSGIVVFSRRNLADSTMRFVTTWRLEKAGWHIVDDSIRSWK